MTLFGHSKHYMTHYCMKNFVKRKDSKILWVVFKFPKDKRVLYLNRISKRGSQFSTHSKFKTIPLIYSDKTNSVYFFVHKVFFPSWNNLSIDFSFFFFCLCFVSKLQTLKSSASSNAHRSLLLFQLFKQTTQSLVFLSHLFRYVFFCFGLV